MLVLQTHTSSSLAKVQQPNKLERVMELGIYIRRQHSCMNADCMSRSIHSEPFHCRDTGPQTAPRAATEEDSFPAAGFGGRVVNRKQHDDYYRQAYVHTRLHLNTCL